MKSHVNFKLNDFPFRYTVFLCKLYEMKFVLY